MTETSTGVAPANGPPKPDQPILLQLARPFLTPNEIQYLHGQTIPEAKKLGYNQRKHHVYLFIFQIIKHFKFPLRVLGTTMNYYQRFYLFNKFEESNSGDVVTQQMTKNSTLLGSSDIDNIREMERDPYVVAITCLFLATKNEDCIKKLKEVQLVSNRLREQEQLNEDRFLYKQRRAIMATELKLLQLLKFDLNNGAPLELLDVLVTQFCKQIGIDYRGLFYAWLVLFDIMLTPLPLTIPAHCIALAIIMVTLYINPVEIALKYAGPSDGIPYSELLAQVNFADFKCPNRLVSEAILYVLDYYVHQMNFSVLLHYMPAIDAETGKEQVFKFMTLKQRLNDLEVLDQYSVSTKELLNDDHYLNNFDYLVAARGASRFLNGVKRRRFNVERHHIANNDKKASDPSGDSNSKSLRRERRRGPLNGPYLGPFPRGDGYRDGRDGPRDSFREASRELPSGPRDQHREFDSRNGYD